MKNIATILVLLTCFGADAAITLSDSSIFGTAINSGRSGSITDPGIYVEGTYLPASTTAEGTALYSVTNTWGTSPTYTYSSTIEGGIVLGSTDASGQFTSEMLASMDDVSGTVDDFFWFADAYVGFYFDIVGQNVRIESEIKSDVSGVVDPATSTNVGFEVYDSSFSLLYSNFLSSTSDQTYLDTYVLNAGQQYYVYQGGGFANPIADEWQTGGDLAITSTLSYSVIPEPSVYIAGFGTLGIIGLIACRSYRNRAKFPGSHPA